MLTLDNLRKKISGEGAENIKESPSILGEKKKRKKRKSAEDSYPQSVYNRRIHDEDEYGVYDKDGNPVSKKKGKKNEVAKMNPKLGTPKDSDANMNENIDDLKYDADVHSDGKMSVGKKPDGKICLYGKSYHSHDNHKEIANKMGMVATDHTKTMGGTRTVLSKKKVDEKYSLAQKIATSGAHKSTRYNDLALAKRIGTKAYADLQAKKKAVEKDPKKNWKLGEARMVKTRGRFDPIVKADAQKMAKHPRYKGNNSKLEADIRKKHPKHADNFVIQNIIRKHAEMHEAVKNEATKGLRIAVGRNRKLQRHLNKVYGPKDVSSRMKSDLEKRDTERRMQTAVKKQNKKFMQKSMNTEEVSNPSDDAADHIVMQLRKSVTLRGMRPVTFKDGKKVKVSSDHAQKWLTKYNSAKPSDKEKMQAMAHKSHDHFQKSLGEGVLSTLGKAAGWASGITPAKKIIGAAGRGVGKLARAGYEKATGGGITRAQKMKYYQRKKQAADDVKTQNDALQKARQSKIDSERAARGQKPLAKNKAGLSRATTSAGYHKPTLGQRMSMAFASNDPGSKK